MRKHTTKVNLFYILLIIIFFISLGCNRKIKEANKKSIQQQISDKEKNINISDIEKQAITISDFLSDITWVISDKKLKTEDIEKWLENYELLISKYKHTNYMAYLQVKYNISRYLVALSKDERSLNKFQEYIKQNPDSQILDALYFGVGYHYFQKGDLNNALMNFKYIMIKFPDSYYTKFLYPQELELLEKEVNEQILIEKTYKEQNDERLWKLGDLYWKSMKKSWNESEVGWNMSLPFALFTELIEKYPDSQWADDASFRMIEYNKIECSEGGDTSGNLVFIKKYESFIKKYPKSELIPNAEFVISNLYFYYVDYKQRNCTREDIDMVNLAKKKLEGIIQKYPYAEVSKKAYDFLDVIKRFEKEYIQR